MTTREWLRSDETAAGSGAGRLDPSAVTTDRFGLVDWVRLFLLRRRIKAMLRSTVGPVRYEPSRALSPHMLKDIGLQPPM